MKSSKRSQGQYGRGQYTTLPLRSNLQLKEAPNHSRATVTGRTDTEVCWMLTVAIGLTAS